MRCSTTVGVGLLWLALGGIFPPAHAAPPNPETRTKESPALPSPAGASRVEMASLPVTEGELTLAQVLDLAERGNAQLAAAADEISAREAAARQAGFLPNPELSVEVELRRPE